MSCLFSLGMKILFQWRRQYCKRHSSCEPPAVKRVWKPATHTSPQLRQDVSPGQLRSLFIFLSPRPITKPDLCTRAINVIPKNEDAWITKMTGDGEMGLHWCEDLSAHCSFDSRGKYAQTDSDKYSVRYCCIRCSSRSCLSISRFKPCPGRATSQSDQLFTQEWVCCQDSADAMQWRTEAWRSGFCPGAWARPGRPSLPAQRVACAQRPWQHLGAHQQCRLSGLAQKLQKWSLHLSKSLCDWPAHLSLRNNEPDLCEILLLKYTIKINSMFYLLRNNGRESMWKVPGTPVCFPFYHGGIIVCVHTHTHAYAVKT